MKITLIGFMGSGKTSVAEHLARVLNLNMIEMDWLVLHSVGCKDMAELFAKGGELLLREWEIKLAEELRETDNVVISAGGGVVMNKIILDYLKEKSGKIIFLHSEFETIKERIEKDKTPRPLFQNIEEAKELYEFRLPLYKRYADYEIMTDGKTVIDIVNEIKTTLNK
ncbi:shikimate kinase [soil metagenome]